MRILIIFALGAPLGYLLASPLLCWADHLLARVTPADAAPLAIEIASPHESLPDSPSSAEMERGSGGGAMPISITPPWRWGLRLSLALLVPLAFARFLPAARAITPLAVLALLACVVILALVAVMDGATHLIFAEILAWPALAVVLTTLPRGLAACLPLLAGAVACGGLLTALYLLGLCVYGTDALGWGDVQLGAVIGLLLGWPGGLRAIIWGFFLMLIIAGALLLFRRITRHSYLPLGVFLVLGALLSLLIQPPLGW